MKLLLFEDKLRENFFPLTLTRFTGDLRCGALKLRQRLEALLTDDEVSFLIDSSIEDLYSERHPDWQINLIKPGDKLFVNCLLKYSPTLFDKIQTLDHEQALVQDNALVAYRSNKDHGSFDPDSILKQFGISTENVDDALYKHPADLVHDNGRMITYDFDNFFSDKDNSFETEPGATILNPYNVWLGEGVELKPGVVIDASDGPVIIDNDALLMHNSVVIGPAYIGKNSIIKVAAKIYENCSIGPVCKVGGELEACIIQAYTNKQHDGFLGHSYLGEWVNLGADTNNSDLKNTYKNVVMHSYNDRPPFDTNTMFMGCIIGDHTKLGINSTINTGCVIGTGSNLWGRDLISGYIPEFSWGEASLLQPYRIDAFLSTAQLVKQRRQLKLSNKERSLYTSIYHRYQENQ